MPIPVISAATAGVLLVLQLVLMLTVGAYRARHHHFIGDSQDPNLQRLVRRHGNLAENAPIFLCALLILELLGTAPSAVAVLGAAFVTARACHAVGFSSLAGSHGEPANAVFAGARVLGAMGTLLSGLTVAGWLLYLVYVHGA